jgi:hypothetical protein
MDHRVDKREGVFSRNALMTARPPLLLVGAGYLLSVGGLVSPFPVFF